MWYPWTKGNDYGQRPYYNKIKNTYNTLFNSTKLCSFHQVKIIINLEIQSSRLEKDKFLVSARQF